MELVWLLPSFRSCANPMASLRERARLGCCITNRWISTVANRWDEKAGLRRDALSSQVIDALEAHEIRRPAFSSHLLSPVELPEFIAAACHRAGVLGHPRPAKLRIGLPARFFIGQQPFCRTE